MDLTSISVSLTILLAIFSIIYYLSTKKRIAGYIMVAMLFFLSMFGMSSAGVNYQPKPPSYLISEYSIYNQP